MTIQPITDILSQIELLSGLSPEIVHSSLVEKYYIAKQNNDRKNMIQAYYSLEHILSQLKKSHSGHNIFLKLFK